MDSGLERKYLAYGRSMGWWHLNVAFRYYCNRQLFSGIDLRGARFLDVGCGNGRFCFWASVRGASEVLGLEPSTEGSGSNRAAEQFRQGIAALGLRNVGIEEVTLQQFDPKGRKFDVVLLHASINHLDERACIALTEDPDAWRVYVDLGRRLRSLLTDGGHLVIVDCARRNLLADLGCRNPLAPHIEWHKHQQPGTWSRLLSEAGFGRPRTRWVSYPTLLHLGVLMRNPVVSYLTISLFRLHLRAL
ncbi:MAG: class I SAM-dependent methyltransferase [Phycisphaerae bacterium]|jgi:SAM-dependent methyltransferase